MNITKDIIRLLTFKTSREEFLNFNNTHLLVGIIGTWLVGMGRYWDDPGAKLLQHLGLGSVIYIFCLALLIWLMLKPFFISDWTYKSVLTFISLTSFPALLYAVPVERFFSIDTSATINAWFLALVAAWRMILLFYFLRKFTQLGWGYIITGALLPVCLIIVTLTGLNLERAVFNIMGGIREHTSNDKAYGVLIVLTMGSTIAAVPLLLGYIGGIINRYQVVKSERAEKTEAS